MRLKSARENNYCGSVILLLSAILVFFFIIAGAETEPQVLEADSSEGKIVAKELPKVNSEKKYSYRAKGKRDPFKPFIHIGPAGEEKRKGKRLTPLEKLELGQLTLTGIVWGAGENMAVVEDSVGRGYILRRGARIGMHSGRVMSILKDSIIIRERHRDHFGKSKSVRTSLKLHDEEEGTR